MQTMKILALRELETREGLESLRDDELAELAREVVDELLRRAGLR